jgi:hypothetical protein
MAAVRAFGENYSFIDTTGKTVIPPQYLTAGEFVDGLAPVEVQANDGVRWGYINKEGTLAISARFTKAYPFSDGIAAVQTPGAKWGFVNTQGNVIIAPKFEQVANFTGGLAQVWTNNNLGYVDKNGKYVWEPK